MRGTTVEGYIGEVVQANLALVMMATGLETFADRRFRELPEEGRRADVEACAAAVLPKNLRATREYNTLSEVLEARTVDFGNYEQAKAAYRAAYGLRFGDDLGVPSGTLEQVKRMLRYRNRIAHVSPMIGFLNQPWVPPEEPEMSGRPLAEAYLAAISAFVQALHQSTLRLR